jgi:outer membrane receptor protein involved in Fe transport
VAGYRYGIDDVVVRNFLEGEERPADLRDLPVDVYRFVNRGEADLTGLEVSAGLRLGPATRLTLAAHRIRAEDGSGVPLSGIPADGLTASLRTRLGSRLSLSGTAVLRARDEELAEGDVVRPGYGVLQVAAALELSEHARLRLALRNALDKSYPVGADDDDPPAPGRSVVLGLTLQR